LVNPTFFNFVRVIIIIIHLFLDRINFLERHRLGWTASNIVDSITSFFLSNKNKMWYSCYWTPIINRVWTRLNSYKTSFFTLYSGCSSKWSCNWWYFHSGFCNFFNAVWRDCMVEQIQNYVIL
jgi:hypothetical protein